MSTAAGDSRKPITLVPWQLTLHHTCPDLANLPGHVNKILWIVIATISVIALLIHLSYISSKFRRYEVHTSVSKQLTKSIPLPCEYLSISFLLFSLTTLQLWKRFHFTTATFKWAAADFRHICITDCLMVPIEVCVTVQWVHSWFRYLSAVNWQKVLEAISFSLTHDRQSH